MKWLIAAASWAHPSTAPDGTLTLTLSHPMGEGKAVG
jgi:hypothetical protein